MRTARWTTAVTTAGLAAAALAVTALTGPAAAAPQDRAAAPQDRGPVRSTVSTAFGTVVGGQVSVMLDGFARTDGAAGVAEAYVGSAECFRPGGGGFAFTADPLRSAAMTGTSVLDCYDLETQRASAATVTVDVHWAASGEPTTSHAVSRRLGCTSTRTTVPAVLTGTVRVVAPDLGVDVVLPASAERPADLATSEDLCRPARG